MDDGERKMYEKTPPTFIFNDQNLFGEGYLMDPSESMMKKTMTCGYRSNFKLVRKGKGKSIAT